ncbi:MAG: putative TIM-barrel fold metal-dependent hydrolase [Candidatus Azotimanducaceae bacterium]|jgi:predicted TIM-barrel fold metal-dependent hydrolase
MAYVENQTIHDADSHVMELPEQILNFMESKYVEAFKPHVRHKDAGWLDRIRSSHEDSDYRESAEAEILARRGHEAHGAFIKEDRPTTLDYLGFTSQLVFTTDALGNYELESGNTNDLAIAAARAHNRMMVEFCSTDRRLLPTGYVPLVDIARAPIIAKEAIELGCKALTIPSTCPPGHSPSHLGFEPLWALAQEAGLPILFHVGGEEKMNPAYHKNEMPEVLDFHGGAENFTSTSFMTIPLSLWQTMSVLIIDGVLDRHPRLMFGAIELGASWVPGWMRYLDAGVAAFVKGEDRLKKLSEKPSDIARRQFRVTPYPHEPTGWIIENSGDEICLFSSDFPHVEGGRNPMKRFSEALEGTTNVQQQRFFRDNFIDLMGNGLDASLHDHPSVKSSG